MKMRSYSTWTIGFGLLLTCAACRDAATATQPSTTPLSIAGTWSGTIVDSTNVAGTAQLTIAQDGQGFSGSWSTQTGARAGSGTISGTATPFPLQLFLTPAVPLVCSGSVTLSGTMALSVSVSGDRLTGTFTVFQCSGPGSGTMTLQREAAAQAKAQAAEVAMAGA